jgi:hypothetical protein
MVMYSGCLFRCTVFYNAMMARKVGRNMEVSQEWQLRFLSYERFMGMLRACAAFSNGDDLLLLGLVKPLFFLYLTPLFI